MSELTEAEDGVKLRSFLDSFANQQGFDQLIDAQLNDFDGEDIHFDEEELFQLCEQQEAEEPAPIYTSTDVTYTTYDLPHATYELPHTTYELPTLECDPPPPAQAVAPPVQSCQSRKRVTVTPRRQIRLKVIWFKEFICFMSAQFDPTTAIPWIQDSSNAGSTPAIGKFSLKSFRKYFHYSDSRVEHICGVDCCLCTFENVADLLHHLDFRHDGLPQTCYCRIPNCPIKPATTLPNIWKHFSYHFFSLPQNHILNKAAEASAGQKEEEPATSSKKLEIKEGCAMTSKFPEPKFYKVEELLSYDSGRKRYLVKWKGRGGYGNTEWVKVKNIFPNVVKQHKETEKRKAEMRLMTKLRWEKTRFKKKDPVEDEDTD